MRRRAAIEPVIGHLKEDHRMGRNYLTGRDGELHQPRARRCRLQLQPAPALVRGVADNIAEGVLGHAIPGVKGVYNRFRRKRLEALDRLARLIDRTVNPPDRTNVVAGTFPHAAGGR
jgi:hypothetical protein